MELVFDIFFWGAVAASVATGLVILGMNFADGGDAGGGLGLAYLGFILFLIALAFWAGTGILALAT